MRILVVDDNPVDVELVKMALNQETTWAPATVVAEDGEQAIELLQSHAADPALGSPDFIVLDLNLPKCDGTEVLHMIRFTEELSRIPVAVLSSSPGDVIERRLTEAGVTADAHFTKPIELAAFLDLGRQLQNWFERWKQGQAAYSAAVAETLV